MWCQVGLRVFQVSPFTSPLGRQGRDPWAHRLDVQGQSWPQEPGKEQEPSWPFASLTGFLLEGSTIFDHQGPPLPAARWASLPKHSSNQVEASLGLGCDYANRKGWAGGKHRGWAGAVLLPGARHWPLVQQAVVAMCVSGAHCRHRDAWAPRRSPYCRAKRTWNPLWRCSTQVAKPAVWYGRHPQGGPPLPLPPLA